MGEMTKKNQRVSFRCIVFLVLGIFVFLLTGCGVMEAEITFYEGESWQYEASLAIFREWIADEGGEEIVESYMSELQTEIRKEAPNALIDLEKEQVGEDKVIYHLIIKDEGWEKLKGISNASITKEGEELYIRMPLSAMSDFEVASITFKGGKIISSNADETTNGSAIWYNPTGTLEAVLVPRQGLSLPLIIFVLGFIVAAIFMIRSFRRV